MKDSLEGLVNSLSKMTQSQRRASYIGVYVLVILLFLGLDVYGAYDEYGTI